TRHDYSAKGLPDRVTPDALPPVAWLTYGSGYLAGMKLGDTPLVEFTRDRLHRETQRRFGEYDLTTAYTPGGQLQSHHLSILQLNRDYTWNSGGQLVHIRGQHEQRDYQYGDAGRLLCTHITSPHHDLAQWTFTDPAGNRTAQQDKYPMLPERFPDNRITQDVENFYHYDEHGRLTEKDERRIRPHGSVVHHYRYDNQHRLTHYRRMQQGNVLTESRYLYDPPGRRVSKRVWACTVFHDGSCSQPALQETVWYAWDGDRLTTTQTDKTRIQTVYLPGSFTPLIRIETATGELTRATRRTLAEKFQQEANVTFPPELVAMVDNLEAELRRGELSEASRTWLAQCGLTPEQMKNQLEPIYIPVRKIHLYHCDHRGLPLALIDVNGAIAWRAEFDEWGNILREDNPYNLEQLIRLPGQQWDKETGLYYNRHRYYDPAQGRYITQDPIGLAGGWNLYQYPLDPIQIIDPLGLSGWDGLGNWLSQPGMKEAYNHAAGEAEGPIAKPISEWEFSEWNVVKGSNHLGTNYINVYAMCKDQFDNTKSVAAKVFQTGLFPLNEIEAGKGIPDPSENIGSKSAPVNTAADCIENLVKAHSRALTCGSKNGYECFMDTVATPELGNKLCGETE
ncbi:TPA: RHS repeat protein, partial [Citrobacter amalonaticus]|nr:RHS repeat protein [Citrobacter amalonaticus]HED3078404.1 RHS repeat protein [Citrobacter amalonaticus]HED3697686.1 RHS repeat protein [Citrobacter amalonaticus]HEM6679045.1 RHS repeat protein [Citrobacter amalonaticus]HEM8624980.1 RHS repeat protein [Citrobacter amalonaticus]